MSDQLPDPRQTEPQRRTLRAILALLAAASVLAVAVVLVLGAAARAGVGCEACHTMSVYAAQHADGTHAGVECQDCHAATGALGIPAQGVSVLRMVVAEPFVDEPPTAAMHFPNAACLECHDAVETGTLTSRGIAVRHEDFLDVACTDCHAGVGHALEARHYRSAQMEDCTGCHRVAVTNLASCSTCHVDDDAARREGATAWRSTHGAGWETAHGMGDLETCTSCHQGDFCVKCHGVRVPHGAEWPKTHGTDLAEETRAACATCHDPGWCDSCHGIEMPHPAGFLPIHGPTAEETGQDTCVNCHNIEYCNGCHLASSHPDLPGVGMGHTP